MSPRRTLTEELERRRLELIRSALRERQYPAAGRGLDVLPLAAHEIDWSESIEVVAKKTQEAFEEE